MISKEQYEKYLEKWQSMTTDLIKELLISKYQIIPLVSTIAVAVLALLSMNKEIITDPKTFKISMIIFICIVPISLWLYFLINNYELNGLIKNEPLSFPINPEKLRTKIDGIEARKSAGRIIRSMFNHIKKGQSQIAKEEFWHLFYTTSPFLLIIILTIAFSLLVVSLS